ncbi:TetR family transcriptional regulator [Microbulbifer bruguierae]|uniref:TetR family transcriptional regulator n=1 Tax=Microbulbifer bruguierae TaxID=3029061 RepID=A0ABY8N849_9GAMM|nr:TetR family transcriptional regulator [Microbulbifer bruguierae]WGL15071.1 TetR family transcriptional regulator [Microbulbifer bruguierae]
MASISGIPHKAPTANKKAEKREIAKAKILNATLDIIARNGLAALSHRTIANEAGVQLAMTTYYFGTLENLIEAAFDLHLERERPWRDEIARRAEALYHRFISTSTGAFADNPGELEDFAEALADEIVEIIYEESTVKKNMISAECQFAFEQNLPEALARKVRALDNSLWDIAEVSCRRLGSSAPRIDGRLLVFTMRELQLMAVRSSVLPDKGMMRACIGRLLRGFQLQS